MTDPLFGVLTGDLKKSAELDAATLDFVRGEVAAAADAALGARRAAVFGGLEFFRGDAWQLALKDGALGLRVAVMIRARLRARTPTDSRVAIALGAVERLNPERVSLSTGEAFTLSGRALDGMTRHGSTMAIALPSDAKATESWASAVIGLCASIIDDWSATQALHVALSLEHPSLSQAAIGRLCSPPITQQSVMESLDRALWPALHRAIATFESADWGFARRGGG